MAAALAHPESVLAARGGERLQFEHDIELGPDGVLAGGMRAAALDEFVQHIARRDVRQIANREARRNLAGCAAAGNGGFAARSRVGGLVGGAISDGLTRTDGGAMTGLAAGLAIGGTAGATWLFRKCQEKRQIIIYRR